jgi:hypothetical protein
MENSAGTQQPSKSKQYNNRLDFYLIHVVFRYNITIYNMKRNLVLLFSLAIFSIAQAQNLPTFSTVPLNTTKDFDSSANAVALQAANYILSVPLPTGNDNATRLTATRFMLEWMAGTPDFNFTVDSTISKIATENDDLVRIYLSALVKYTIENKQAAKKMNQQKLNAFKITIAYCKVANNNVQIIGELKKLIAADDAGKLAEYLKL